MCNVDYCRRSLIGSDSIADNLSQRRRTKYDDGNNDNNDFITAIRTKRLEAVSRSSLVVDYVYRFYATE